jgi:hypothetical protein
LGLKITPAAVSAYELADDVIRNVDFQKVLESPIALSMPDGSKLFTLSGRSAREGYVVDYHKASLEAIPIRTFADFGAELKVRQTTPVLQESRGFGVFVRGKVNTGEASHKTLTRLGTGAIKVIDPQNIQQLTAPAAPQFSSLDRITQKAMDELMHTLPRSMALLTTYTAMAPTYLLKQQEMGRYTEAVIIFTLKLEKIKADYPHLGEYIERLIEKFEFEGVIKYRLKAGLTLGEMKIDSKSTSLKISFKTADGKVIPYDKKGRLKFAEAINFAEVRQHKGEVSMHLYGKVFGLRMNAPNIVMATSYKDGQKALLRAKLVQFPPPAIAGRAFGLFPTWAINLTIPDDIEGYCKKFTTTLLKANGGKGTSLHVGVDTRIAENTMVSYDFRTEFLDNFFLNFGLRIMQAYLWPSVDVIKDGWRLAQTAIAALTADMKRLQEGEANGFDTMR